MASAVLKSTVGWADATGRGYQQKLFWCSGSACWILIIWLPSDGKLHFYYNPSQDFQNGIWYECSGSPYTLTSGSGSLISGSASGCNFSAAMRQIGGVDVFHLETYTDNFGSNDTVHIRGRIDATAVSVQSETTSGTSPGMVSPPEAISVEIAGDNKPITGYDRGTGTVRLGKWSNADTGTSWTPGTFPAGTGVGTPSFEVNGVYVFPLNISNNPGGSWYAIFEDAAAADPTSLTQPKGSLSAGVQVDLGFTALGGTDVNNMGMSRGGPVIDAATPQLHCVLRTGANTFVHRKTTPGTVTWVAGDSIPNQNCKDGGGLFIANDGTNLWLFIIDSDAANTIRYIKHNGSAWDASWTALETSTKTRTNISGHQYIPGQYIGVCWTEVNGGNFDIVGTTVNVPAIESSGGRGARPNLGWGVSNTVPFNNTIL